MLKFIDYRSLCFILGLVLQACGGSSTEQNSNAYERYTFSLQGQLANKCGVLNNFSDFEFYLQDNEWNTIKKYQPDNKGRVSFIITDDIINYTIVAQSQEGEDIAGFDIVSFYNVDTTSPAVYSATYDSQVNDASCQCNKQNVQLRHRPFTEITSVLSSASFNTFSAIDERTTEFTDVTVCRSSSQSWPVHSFAVLGLNSNDEVIGAAEFLENFSATNNNVWEASAVEVADYTLTLDKNHQPLSTSQLILGNEHFGFSIPSEQRELHLFNSHIYSNEALFVTEASHEFVDANSLLGTFKLRSERRITSEVAEQSLTVSADKNEPEIDQQYLSELKPDGSYDFTKIRNFPMVIAEFDYGVAIDNINIPVTWTMYGPKSGILPIAKPLSDYLHIIGERENIIQTKITLLKSNTTNRYLDYVTFAQLSDPKLFSSDIERIVLEVK